MGFLLGLPANEIVIPLILSIYLQQGGLTETGNLLSLHELLAAQGWTPVTALCTLVFMLFHWPCATTVSYTHLDVYKRQSIITASGLSSRMVS